MEKTGTIVIEFTYDDEDQTLKTIERYVDRCVNSNDSPMTDVLHLEASDGDMEEAFGIEDLE